MIDRNQLLTLIAAEDAREQAELAHEQAERANKRAMIAGQDGRHGIDGRNGIDGKDGQDGRHGNDGKDGANGRDGINGKDGKDGPQGQRGYARNGKDGKDGKDGQDGTSLVWMHKWDKYTTYLPNHLVEHKGSTYIALAESTGEAPPLKRASNDFWHLMAKRGADGATGATGGTWSLGIGGGGGSAGTVTASDVSYSNSAYPLLTNVQQALDQLLFFTMTASLSGGSNQERGASIASVALSWSYNKSISAQTLSGSGSTTPLLADRSQTVNGPFTSNTTWTVQGTSLDASENPTATTTLAFMDKRYWGVSSLTTLTDAQIIALSSELSATRVQSRTLSPSGQYLYFAFPTSFGTPTFFINGLLNTAWTKVRSASTFVNASGASVSYDVWRSNNLLTSTYDISVT